MPDNCRKSICMYIVNTIPKVGVTVTSNFRAIELVFICNGQLSCLRQCGVAITQNVNELFKCKVW